VMKNTSKLISKEFEEVKTETGSVDNIEENLIKEHLQQIKVHGMDAEKEIMFVHSLMHSLSAERYEGETVTVFENRLKDEIDKILEL